MPLNRRHFMNTYIDDVTLAEAVSHIEICIAQRKIGQVITPNVDQIVRMEWDDTFRKICEDCELLLVDGHPLLWIAKAYGTPFKQKICGSDLVPQLCELAAKKGITVAQVAMAWIYNQKFDVFALSSPVTQDQIDQNIAAIEIELTDEEVAWLNLE